MIDIFTTRKIYNKYFREVNTILFELGYQLKRVDFYTNGTKLVELTRINHRNLTYSVKYDDMDNVFYIYHTDFVYFDINSTTDILKTIKNTAILVHTASEELQKAFDKMANEDVYGIFIYR